MQEHLIGRLYALMGSFMIFIMFLVIKTSKDASVIEIVYFRTILSTLFAVQRAKVNNVNIYPKNLENTKVYLIRGLTGGVIMTTMLCAVGLTSIQEACILSRSNLIFAALFAQCYSEHKITIFKGIMYVLAFTGIVLVVFNKDIQLSTELMKPWILGLSKHWIGNIMSLFVGVSSAATRVYLSNHIKKFEVYHNIFYLNFGGSIFISILLCLFINHITLTSNSIVCYSIMGLSGYFFQYFVYYAVKYENNPAIVNSIMSMSILYSFIFETFYLGIPMTYQSLVGGLILASSGILLLVFK